MPGCWLVVEQPVNSMFFDQEGMAELLVELGMQRITVHLGRYGSDSAKPCWIYSNAPWLLDLYLDSQSRPSDTGSRCTLTNVHADGSVSGNSLMASSEEYPWDFCVSRQYRLVSLGSSSFSLLPSNPFVVSGGLWARSRLLWLTCTAERILSGSELV